MTKIKIAGAGPGGLCAAINLSKAGYEVEVYERNHDSGIRFHGDLQGLENWSTNTDALTKLKKMNISINFNYNPFKKLYISNGVKVWDFNCKKPAFYLISRGPEVGSLDHRLKEQALDYGVDIHFNQVIPPKETDIIATGPDAHQKFAAARGIVFKTDHQDMVIGLVNNTTAVKGYSYLLVTGGKATMASVLFDQWKNLNHCFEHTKKTFNKLIDLQIKNPQKMGGIGSFSQKNPFQINGRLYVGEAAGIQDFLWGFGIKYALESGFIAAKSIINHEDYEKISVNYFNNRFKASIVNRFLWEEFGINNYAFIVERIHKSKDPLKFLNRLHNFNIYQKILYPIAIKYIRNRYENLEI